MFTDGLKAVLRGSSWITAVASPMQRLMHMDATAGIRQPWPKYIKPKHLQNSFGRRLRMALTSSFAA
jgi:hypothetical protein